MTARSPHDSNRRIDHGANAVLSLDQRAAIAARAELRGERAGILGAIGQAALPTLARARRVPDQWSFILGVGVDCCMLLRNVFVDTGLVPPFDPRPYAADWHLHRSEERYLGFIFDRCSEVTAPQPGDVMMIRIGRCYSHGGIVTGPDPLTIVHAYFQARRVIEEDVAHNSRLCAPERKPRFFSFWAKT